MATKWKRLAGFIGYFRARVTDTINLYAAYDQCCERLREGKGVRQWPTGTYAPGFAVAA